MNNRKVSIRINDLELKNAVFEEANTLEIVKWVEESYCTIAYWYKKNNTFNIKLMELNKKINFELFFRLAHFGQTILDSFFKEEE